MSEQEKKDSNQEESSSAEALSDEEAKSVSGGVRRHANDSYFERNRRRESWENDS